METQFLLAAIFGDHMVLRHDRPVLIFGAAANGARITAEIDKKQAYTTAKGHRFELALPPMAPGGPFTLMVTDGETTFTYADVMIGEVYLAGGQSNMELELKDSGDGSAIVASADNPMIRYYNVLKAPWLDRQALAQERQTCWRALAPGQCGDISAVAYHFAARLQAELNMAVGIIGCYWGGTSVTCWMDEAALRATAEGAALLTEYNAIIAAKSQTECDEEVRAHDAAMEKWNAAIEALRVKEPNLGWSEICKRAGPCPWNPPANRKSPFRPAGLAETMVKRVAPYTLTGILYYQGEEDTKHPGLYRPLMTTLIVFWRQLFRDDDLPFLFVQLPVYISSDDPENRQWAVLREAQEQTCRTVRNTGLVVMIDGGEADNIHPMDKKTVGERLYRQALRVVYGRISEPESPRALFVWRDGTEMALAFSEPIRAEGEPRWFELADATGRFAPAKAIIKGCGARLSADGITEPQAVRYAWYNYAVVNVFGENGLPLAPFRL
jgi:sialate O-acetylesterase